MTEPRWHHSPDAPPEHFCEDCDRLARDAAVGRAVLDVHTLAKAVKAHRAQVRREWQEAHQSDPEYGDIFHMCDDDCAAAILAALKEVLR